MLSKFENFIIKNESKFVTSQIYADGFYFWLPKTEQVCAQINIWIKQKSPSFSGDLP